MLDFFLILLFGTGVGWLVQRIRLPAALGQVLIGLVLGPAVLDWLTMDQEPLHLLGNLGVVLLLGIAGMQLGVRELARAGWAGLWVAVLGIVFCFVGGYIFAIWWGSPGEEALYTGIVLTATSIGISVQVLHQFGLIRERIGQIVVAAAVIDDVVALYLLAIAHGVLSNDFGWSQIAVSSVLALGAIMAVFIICQLIGRVLASRISADEKQYGYWVLLTACLILAAGWFTQWAGFSMVVGGFFAGLGFNHGLGNSKGNVFAQRLYPAVFLLVPFFFVLIGAQAEFSVLSETPMLIFLLGILPIAIIGKTLGGLIGAIGLSGLRLRLLVGVSMAPRGEVALVIASLGFAQGHMSHHVFVALVIMTVGAALLGPALMTTLVRHQRT